MSASVPGTAREVLGLERLHPEQQEAVTHGEGPLMIVAGAGTGKTQVITHRIAWLISSKRARPEQILALTFTDKAAAEMESRVDQLVPYGLVGATIATFNAFCDRLVREHAVEIGLTSRLRVESEAEILVFLRERVFELGLERYLPIGEPDSFLRALLALFSRARNEDVPPERYRAFAESLAAAAGTDPERLDRAAAELEKARAYERFEELLFTAGRVDFDSQIRLALRLLRERPHVRRAVQDQYRWILVDEFQDTNHVQFELVRLLAGERRNLTVVGDDDQSIYRFRGAKIENILQFLELYPDAHQVLLQRNHRSGQRILDDAHRLIRANDPWRLESQRGIDKRLMAQRTDPANGEVWNGSVEHVVFATGRDESEWVADQIGDALAAGRARAGDFAILARGHGSLDPFALALQARGIRFRRVGMRGLYARPEVLLCLNALRAIADPESGAVHPVLGDALFGADPVDLARLGHRAKRLNRGLLRVARAAVDGRDPQLDDLTPATRDAIGRFAALHAALCESALRRPTSEVLYQFVTESGFLAALTAEESAEALEKVQNLNKLFGIVTRVGPLLKADRVPAFIEHLDLLIEMGDDPAAAEIEADDDAVSLLTAHGAKGLEYPVVFVVHLVEQRFPPYRRSEGLEFPPELRPASHTGVPADANDDHYREERRLFYVAMTRARDRLVLTHAADYGGKRATKMSRFVSEALDLPAPPKGARGATALQSLRRYAPVAAPAPAPLAPLPDGHPLTLSNSQIDDWLTCPLKYLFAHVAHVPLAGDPGFMFGNAVHHAIKVWHQHRIKGLPIDVADVLTAFESAWSSEGFLTVEHEERMLEQGREALRRFVARDAASQRTPLAVETEFRFKVGDDVVVGRWDRIDERDGGIVLVDYKSSEVDDPEKAEERAVKSLKEGQLGLYALAYHEARGVLPAQVELQFVGTGVTGTADVEPEHLERARDRVREAAAGIRAASYPPRPDQRNCGWCSYRAFCQYSAARRT